jgi:hypothetical protein
VSQEGISATVTEIIADALVQNHIFGDILKRQITGELRMRF